MIMPGYLNYELSTVDMAMINISILLGLLRFYNNIYQKVDSLLTLKNHFVYS